MLVNVRHFSTWNVDVVAVQWLCIELGEIRDGSAVVACLGDAAQRPKLWGPEARPTIAEQPNHVGTLADHRRLERRQPRWLAEPQRNAGERWLVDIR